MDSVSKIFRKIILSYLINYKTLLGETRPHRFFKKFKRLYDIEILKTLVWSNIILPPFLYYLPPHPLVLWMQDIEDSLYSMQDIIALVVFGSFAFRGSDNILCSYHHVLHNQVHWYRSTMTFLTAILLHILPQSICIHIGLHHTAPHIRAMHYTGLI